MPVVERVVKIMSAPEPQRLSVVRRGANKRGWRAFKADDLTTSRRVPFTDEEIAEARARGVSDEALAEVEAEGGILHVDLSERALRADRLRRSGFAPEIVHEITRQLDAGGAYVEDERVGDDDEDEHEAECRRRPQAPERRAAKGDDSMRRNTDEGHAARWWREGGTMPTGDELRRRAAFDERADEVAAGVLRARERIVRGDRDVLEDGSSDEGTLDDYRPNRARPGRDCLGAELERQVLTARADHSLDSMLARATARRDVAKADAASMSRSSLVDHVHGYTLDAAAARERQQAAKADREDLGSGEEIFGAFGGRFRVSERARKGAADEDEARERLDRLATGGSSVW